MSQSLPPENPENPENPPGAREFRRTHKYSASTPANMQAYAHRPLPPLPELPLSAPRAKTTPPPKPLKRSASTSGGQPPAFAFQGSFPINRGSNTRARTPTSVPRQSPPGTVSCPLKRSSSYGGSHAASIWSRRSSQQKVMQLTGMDVDVMDDQHVHPGGEDSDSSSIGSGVNLNEPATYEMPECYLVPVLETDLDDNTSSRGSSWGPLSPELAIVPLPLNIHKQPLRDGMEKHSVSLSDPLTHLHLEDDVIRPWDSAPGQFTDYGAAGEYHQFASQLASRDARQASDHTLQSAMPSKKKRSSLSLALSAASRFRRRDHPQPVDIGAKLIRPKSSTQNSSKKSQPEQLPNQEAAHSLSAPTTPIIALATAPPPRPSPAPPLMSVWDSDSDEEASDSHVMSNLKDWLASRNSEDGKLHKRTYSAPRAGSDRPSPYVRQAPERESIISARERQKQILMEKAAKRREQVRSQMRMVPEGAIFNNLYL